MTGGGYCSVEGCDREDRIVKGMCHKHYLRFLKWGDATIDRSTIPVEERFWSKVRPSGECWEWTGTKHGMGYGVFYPSKKRRVLAHRYVYEAMVAPIPDGLVIDHLCHGSDPQCAGGPNCKHRRCVNPYHLEPVPDLENLSRGAGYAIANGRRATCVNGHERTPENTYTQPSTGKRRCRECMRESDRRRAPRIRRKEAE